MLARPFLLVTLIALAAVPLAAKDSLGVFDNWGAFRDPAVPRCYAIAAPMASSSRRDTVPFASIGTWPKRGARGQAHFRLSRQISPRASINLHIGTQDFALTGGGGNAWAVNREMDAQIVAAMRSNSSMTVSARDRSGNRFTDRYSLLGAATALDAATIGCSRLG